MDLKKRSMLKLIDRSRRAEGRVRTNPLVAAGLMKNGSWLAKDHHPRYGKKHAEARLLSSAKNLGISFQDATLYTTLEPCIHPGKTSACLDRLVEEGIERVVISVSDPHPAVNAGGIRALKNLNVDVEVGIGADAYRWVNRAYFYGVKTGYPWLDVKWAVSADGYIAPQSGESRWITGDQSRAAGHRIRSRVDAVMVGANTLRQDNPRLTDRVTDRGHQPDALIVARDPSKLPTDCELFKNRREKTLVIVPRSMETTPTELEKMGVRFIYSTMRNNRYDWETLLPRLRKHGYGRILAEGGGLLCGSLVEAGRACEIHGFYSGRMFGKGTKSLQFTHPAKEVRQAPTARLLQAESLGEDVYVHRLGTTVDDFYQAYSAWFTGQNQYEKEGC